MKILVCIKQIPDTNDVRWTKENNIIRDGVISIINPYDMYGILAAKSIKDAHITFLSMGPMGAERSLREALSYCGDDAILLSDKRFSGADTLATAKTLFYAIKNVIKDYDLIITGQFAQDGDTAQTPYSLANLLNIPNIGYVQSIDSINDEHIEVTSVKDNGVYKINGKFPILISMSKFDKTYTPLAKDYIRAQEKEVKILNADDIVANYDEIGIKGSPTYVSKAFRPINNRICKFVSPESFIGELQ